MSNVMKFLLMAFSLMITCLLVTYGGRILRVGKDTSDIALKKINNFNSELSESELTMYDGMDVRGSDVVNFIKKNLGSFDVTENANFYVQVVTATNDSTYTNGTYLSDIQNFSTARWIKPTTVFLCSIIRDANDMILGVSYTQR